MKASSHRAKIRNAIRKVIAITRYEESDLIAAIEKSLQLGTPAAKGQRPESADASIWPVIWRVNCPRAGSHNYDMTFYELEDEKKARSALRSVRKSGYPARFGTNSRRTQTARSCRGSWDSGKRADS